MNAAGKATLLALSALGVLCIAWGAYSHWSEDSRPSADGPAEIKVTLEHLAAAPRISPAHPVARVSMRSEQPALELADPEAPDQRAALDESLVPCVELATEQSVLEALDEPDDEARYQRLQETIGSGAEVPVERIREVLVTDPSDKVRELALTALTQHPDATPEEIRAVAEGALANPSLTVRAHAERILQQMNELERIDRESREMEQQM
jgi:hypothetical protein